MPARRSAETMEKDATAYDLFRRGLSYRQIATQVGWKSPKSAVEAVRRGARENAVDPLEAAEARQAFLDRFQDYRRAAQRVLSSRHYLTTQAGHLTLGPDGQPLPDDDPVLRALDRLLKVDDMELRLRDLYPAAKSKVEVITDDVLDRELQTLNAQLAANDPPAPSELPHGPDWAG
jgi:hypothetical protein